MAEGGDSVPVEVCTPDAEGRRYLERDVVVVSIDHYEQMHHGKLVGRTVSNEARDVMGKIVEALGAENPDWCVEVYDEKAGKLLQGIVYDDASKTDKFVEKVGELGGELVRVEDMPEFRAECARHFNDEWERANAERERRVKDVLNGATEGQRRDCAWMVLGVGGMSETESKLVFQKFGRRMMDLAMEEYGRRGVDKGDIDKYFRFGAVKDEEAQEVVMVFGCRSVDGDAGKRISEMLLDEAGKAGCDDLLACGLFDGADKCRPLVRQLAANVISTLFGKGDGHDAGEEVRQ